MTPPARPTSRAAVVYNPVKVDVAKLRSVVGAAEREHGWRASLWLETSPEDPGAGVARRAVDEGVDVVMAAGGDGTVRAVAEGLRSTGTPLTLLPSGTGNLLARNLHLPLSRLEPAVTTAFTGVDQAIDVGLVDIEREDGEREEHAFVVMAGVGLDAKMVANARPELKKRVGWLAYVDAIARSLRDTEAVRIHYRVDDGPTRSMRAHTLLVGNCGLLPGNILLLPDAEIDDGVLDVVTLRPEGFAGWVQIWSKIVWENGVLRRSTVGRQIASRQRPVRSLRYFETRGITVAFPRALEFELDGDEFGSVVGFRATVDPAGLIVRTPRAH